MAVVSGQREEAAGSRGPALNQRKGEVWLHHDASFYYIWEAKGSCTEATNFCRAKGPNIRLAVLTRKNQDWLITQANRRSLLVSEDYLDHQDHLDETEYLGHLDELDHLVYLDEMEYVDPNTLDNVDFLECLEYLDNLDHLGNLGNPDFLEYLDHLGNLDILDHLGNLDILDHLENLETAAQLRLQSHVISELDYCDSPLAGLPLQAIRPSHLVQNGAA
ncbi:hypothetical protein NFI96_022252 [Prochilodus magdalenae]|nr:hypothetical protein NFI96_022252 [Prochilodus magdalenae]